MTRDAGGSRVSMTQRMTRAAAAILVVILLGGSLVACGRYGPPQPYPPGVDGPDRHDDEDLEQQP
jgi:predicted small lipoprotein YifL